MMRMFFRVFSNRILVLVFFNCSFFSNCNANVNFNASLRDYSQQEHINTTNIKTLQKEDFAKHTYFAPMRNVPQPQYREIQDNVLSGSAYSHGATHHEIPATYGVHDFEESHYGHLGHGQYNHIGPSFEHHGGGYDHIEPGLAHHGFDHHGLDHHAHGHHLGFGYGHGHHHKHIDHALSAKAILLPVAGLAILGAAAALVSNPVLLQLGVVSGRKRRDTTGLGDEQDTTNWIHKPDFRTQPEIANRKDWETETAWGIGRFQKASLDKKNGLNKKPLLKGLPIRQSTIEAVSLDAQGYDSFSDSDVNFVPVPLKLTKGYRKHVP